MKTNLSFVRSVCVLFAGSALAFAGPVCPTYTPAASGPGGTLTCSLAYSIDTSSIEFDAGILDIQFNPGSETVLDYASVTIPNSMFSTDGTLGGIVDDSSIPTPSGDVSGGPLGTADLTIDNQGTGGFNDYEQYITYGTYLDFTLNFTESVSGAADTGTAFALSLYDNLYNPLLTSDPGGTLIDVALGACTGSSDCPSSVTTTNNFQAQVSGTPEPSAWFLAATGLGALAFRRYRAA